jgi:AraC-like DNA-binding protein
MPNVAHDGIKRWSTADVPQQNRLDYFAAALSEAVNPLGVDNADPRTFRAELSHAQLAAIAVSKTVGSPHVSIRGRSELARVKEHKFNLLMTLETPWTAEHRGQLHLLPRDIVIIDSQYPLRTSICSSFVAISVSASEAWLRQWLPNPNLLVARRIPGDSLWGLALSSYVSELTPDLAGSPPLPLSVIADQVGSLLALTANGLRDTTLAYGPAERSLRERIEDCLLQRCTESELTATDIADCMNISLRTLHRVFAATNETFGENLIKARARIALRMLTSPSFNRLTTAEIGRRAGFLSASHFARVMRSQTGHTPLNLRRAAGTKEPEAEDLN